MGKKSFALGRSLADILKDHSAPAASDIQQPNPQSGENNAEKSETVDNSQKVVEINVELIDPNPFQPRKVFSDDELVELAESIEHHGLIQPIAVRKVGDRYQLISGERRTRASRLAGLKTIKAQEVIHRGFMSNLLFANVGVVFGAPGAVKAILDKIPKAQEQPKKDTSTLDDAGDIHTNAQGEVEIPGAMVINQTKNLFGEKKYEDVQKPVEAVMNDAKAKDDSHKVTEAVTKAVVKQFRENNEEKVKDEYDLTQHQTEQAFRHSEQHIQQALDKVADNHEIKQNVLKAEHAKKIQPLGMCLEEYVDYLNGAAGTT